MHFHYFETLEKINNVLAATWAQKQKTNNNNIIIEDLNINDLI